MWGSSRTFPICPTRKILVKILYDQQAFLLKIKMFRVTKKFNYDK